MNNSWNRFIYKLWSPLYDTFFNRGIFLEARKSVFENQSFKEGQNVLFIGVGTGAELELINYSKLHITAIDYSPEMLHKAKTKFSRSSIKFLEMDAQELSFKDETFDVVVGSLIISVVPDANRCFQEMIRVLKPNGTILLFDKFAPMDRELSLFKKMIRPIIAKFGTDIGVNFEQLASKYKDVVEINVNKGILFNGMFRKIMITKKRRDGSPVSFSFQKS